MDFSYEHELKKKVRRIFHFIKQNTSQIVFVFFYSIIQRLKQTIIQETWKERKTHNWIAYGLPVEQNQIYSEILTIAMSIWTLGNPFRKMHDKRREGIKTKNCNIDIHIRTYWSISLYKLHIVCIDSSKAYTETSICAIV